MIASSLGRTPLIGRRSELTLTGELLASLPAGRGGVLAVTGEAGAGKSRLVAAIAGDAEARGLVVRRAACFAEDRLVPYAPILELLRADSPPRSGLPGSAGLRGATELLSAIGAGAPDEPQRVARRLADHLAADLAELPALIVGEDLHWCDDLSLDTLRRLARHTTHAPILLVLTYRSDDPSAAPQQLLAELHRERLLTELRLPPLTPDEVDRLIRGIFGQTRPIRRDFLEAIYALTKGNPFFVEEVLAALVAGGDIFQRDGVWDRAPLDKLRIPRSIRSAVQERVRRLDPSTRELLVAAAVIGRRFDFDLLQAMTVHDETELLPALKTLVAEHLVIEEAPDQFVFRHELTREALLSGLLHRERQALHRRVVAALERLGRDSDQAVAGLARHAFEAGDWPRAPRYAEQAGERARLAQAPTLVITGEDDWVVHPRASRVLASRIPRAELLISPRTSHMSFVDRPDLVLSAAQWLLGAGTPASVGGL